MYLVRKGVPFRRAHEAVGNAVHICIERGCELDGLTIDELRTYSFGILAMTFTHV